MKHLVLMCPAVNRIDASGLESLEAINHRLKDAGVTLHLSEVKGPVMDRLKKTHFLDELTGQVFMHQYEAMPALDGECVASAFDPGVETTNPEASPCPSKRLAGLDPAK